MAREKEIRLDEMPSRVICEEQEDGSVVCRVFQSDRIKDFKVNEEEDRKTKPYEDTY